MGNGDLGAEARLRVGFGGAGGSAWHPKPSYCLDESGGAYSRACRAAGTRRTRCTAA